jgi:hypothetical protein
MSDLFWRILVFDFLAAFFVAQLEIQIEGPYGWAEQLPTKVINNKLVQLVFSPDLKAFTYYHLWLFFTVLFLIQLPFFVIPNFWSFSNELFLLGNFLLTIGLEDFFWFILNPSYGFKKLNKQHATWHHWIGPIPILYIRMLVFYLILVGLSQIIHF